MFSLVVVWVWPVKEEVTVALAWAPPFELDITLARRLPLPVLLSLVGLEFWRLSLLLRCKGMCCSWSICCGGRLCCSGLCFLSWSMRRRARVFEANLNVFISGALLVCCLEGELKIS